MTSTLVALRGVQRPRLLSLPQGIVSTATGEEAVELAAMAGLFLDPWQAWLLTQSLAERRDGSFAAFEVVEIVARQNGKGSTIEARELALLFLLGEKLGMHSAHQFDTSLEAFTRIMSLIESTPDLDRQVRRVLTGNGKEVIETKSGSRLRFRARTKSGGRGWAGVDLLVLDEAMELPETAVGAVVPTLSTRPNAQIWFAGSAVDQRVHVEGTVLTRLRERGMSGDEKRMLFAEFSPGERTDLDAGLIDIDDPAVIAEANPGLGGRSGLTMEAIGRERLLFTQRTYEVERMSIGDWPKLEEYEQLIEVGKWNARALDWDSPAAVKAWRAELAPISLGVECTPDRSMTSIGVVGRRRDGLVQVELAKRDAGVAWAYSWLADRATRRKPAAVVIDPGGPAGFMIGRLEELGVKVEQPSAREVAQACGAFTNLVNEGGMVHPAEPVLTTAANVVRKRKLRGGDSWVFEIHNTKADVAPIRAVALALHGLTHPKKSRSGKVW